MPCNNSTPCNCNDCGSTHIQTHICNPCSTPPPCDCEVIDLSTDCSTYKGDNILCESVVVIQKNTTLSNVIKNLVSWVCTRLAEVQKYFVIKNIGGGAKIFKQNNLIGEKELKTLTSLNNSVTIMELIDTIDFSVNPTDGSETKIVAGTNVNITGNGTLATPYLISSEDNNTTYSAGIGLSLIGTTFNNTTPDQVVEIIGAGATSVTGTYPNFTISSVNTIADGSETKIVNGDTTTISGDGTLLTPYKIEVENLQKVISTFPYTLNLTDDKHTIFINNGNVSVVVNVPNGIVSNFSCVFIQEGTGEVTLQASGSATVLYPPTFQNKIKGQNFWAMIEKKQTTDNYFLLGSLMPL